MFFFSVKKDFLVLTPAQLIIRQLHQYKIYIQHPTQRMKNYGLWVKIYT